MATQALQRLQLVPPDSISDPERRFLLSSALLGAIRLDGRGLNEPRPCSLSVSTVARSRSLARCSLGDATKVACLVSAELVAPYPDRPNEGSIVIQTDYMHSAGPSPSSTFDLQLVERAILRAIDVESLCVVPGSRVWAVKCQLVVEDDCGAVLDACSIAACAALLHFRRPEVTVLGEEVTVHSIEERVPVPLSVHYIPLCISFALLDVQAIVESEVEAAKSDDKQERNAASNSNVVALVDPTDREEDVAQGGHFQVILNAHREVCGMVEGGPLLPRSTFRSLIEVAASIRQERGLVLDDAVRNSPFLA